jgi:nitrogen fixation-related uncharacterized protein
MNPNRILTLMQPFLNVLLVIFLIVFFYGWLSNEDYEDDDFSVTITYDCKRVLTDRDYPAEVLSECLELRNEMQNRIK